MESLDTAGNFMDHLLDFPSDIDDEEEKPITRKARRDNGLAPVSFGLLDASEAGRPLPELQEEELEWISNKDAFPAVETFVDMLPGYHRPESPQPPAKQLSPVSVLETSSQSTTSTVTTTATTHSSGGSNGSSTTTITIMSCCRGDGAGLTIPVKARSKRRRTGRRVLPRMWTQHHEESHTPARKKKSSGAMSMGRKCQHCLAEKTPQWRAGPMGAKTLCNACGVRFKSGRLVAEYRPASSPTFMPELFSNSHRKILEMRRQKQLGVSSATGKGCG